MTIADLKKLADGCSLKYYAAPGAPQLLAVFAGMFGAYDVTITLQSEGEFLQFGTQNYGTCSADHPHLTATLATLARLNSQRRMTKFGWDPNDGEIMAFADVWVMDGALTQRQFDRMVASFVPTIDVGRRRIQQALDSGVDPGDHGALLGPSIGLQASLVEKLKDILKAGAPPAEEGPITEI